MPLAHEIPPHRLTDEQGSQVHHHVYLSTLLTLNIEIQNTTPSSRMKDSKINSNHIMLEQKLDENNCHKRNQKLEVFDVLRAALAISFKNFNFIIFIFLTSLPFFCFMFYYEIFLQRTLVETSNSVNEPPGYFYRKIPDYSTEKIMSLQITKDLFQKLFHLGFLYLVPLHLAEFCSVIVIVDLASKIHVEERPLTLKEMKEMIHKLYYGERLRGTFITSIYILFVSTCILIGLIWLNTNSFQLGLMWLFADYRFIIRDSAIDVFFAVFYGIAFVALLTKYLEWSAMWNMSVVISVLEGIYGGEAFALSAYFSKGSEGRGLLLMLVFFVWGLGLRLPCLYFGCYEGGRGIVAQISSFCLGNVLKWVVCMVYFYDCKKRILEKKVDEEVGRDIEAVGA
ncbi:hypothetical protein SO802_011725 [Lithocarpus litseifolius]|uniref:Transmembrane protein n=1 Tax=Lithocarpus litseifolius TaxID=425828 RepID=A0AAW2D3G4_9ROSI